MRRLRRLGLSLVVAILLAGPVLAGEDESALTQWSQGPVRWLLLPSEWRELKKVESPAEALNFVEEFWRLRDSNNATQENEYRALFNERVEAANLLYEGEGEVGSLTARGRALILLGPPPHMRLGTEESLTWKPKKGNQRSSRREFKVEIWRYPKEDLPEKLISVLRAADLETTVELKFRLGRRGVSLESGDTFLLLSSRLALVQD